MKAKLLFIILLCNYTFGSAQTKKWTLKECVDYALKNNISVKKSEVDIKTASVDILAAKGNFLPNLTASASQSWNSGLSINRITNTNITAKTQSNNFGINSSITLYNGLINLKKLRKAKLTLLSNQYKLNDMKDNISLNVCNAFLQVLFNKESLKTLKQQYELSVKEIKNTKELITEGSKPKGDLLEIEATLADQGKSVTEMENKVLLSKLTLFNLLQLNNFDTFDVSDNAYDLIPSKIPSNNPEEVFEKSLTFKNNIKANEVAIEIAKNDIKIAKGAYHPTLTGSFGITTRYQHTNIPSPKPQESFINQLKNFKGTSFGLSLNIPVFSKLQNYTSVKKSKLQLEQAKLDLQKSKFDLKDKVYQAFSDTKGALKTYESTQKALDSRKLAYKYATEKFNLGAIDSFTFNQSKTKYTKAETEVIRAKYDYIFKLKILEYYFGVPINL